MSLILNTNPGGLTEPLIPEEITGSFSITKDGFHFEIVRSNDNYSFKIFDVDSTKLIHSGEIERLK